MSIDRGRLTGVDMAESRIEDVTFRDCRIDLASFAQTLLVRTTFEDCVLSECDFGEARLQSVRLERCDLSGADFSDARFVRCELRGCRIDGARGPASISGVAMSVADTVAASTTFAAALGIAIIDEPD